MRTYPFWLRAAAVVQIATAIIHSTSFFVSPEPANETERQMLDLLQNHKLDLGAGFHPAMADLMTGLSMCFTLLYLLGAIIAFYLLRKRVEAGVMKGLVNIYLAIFGVAFLWMALFTFLPPIVLTGLVFVLLTVARIMPFNSSETDTGGSTVS